MVHDCKGMAVTGWTTYQRHWEIPCPHGSIPGLLTHLQFLPCLSLYRLLLPPGTACPSLSFACLTPTHSLNTQQRLLQNVLPVPILPQLGKNPSIIMLPQKHCPHSSQVLLSFAIRLGLEWNRQLLSPLVHKLQCEKKQVARGCTSSERTFLKKTTEACGIGSDLFCFFSTHYDLHLNLYNCLCGWIIHTQHCFHL